MKKKEKQINNETTAAHEEVKKNVKSLKNLPLNMKIEDPESHISILSKVIVFRVSFSLWFTLRL